jgi:hypothetical protein
VTGWRHATRRSSYDGNDRGVWMSALPRVAGLTWERIAREFDDRGPEVCCTGITLDLQENSPELLDMAARCARDVGDPVRIMRGFCMSYRLLTAEAFADSSAAQHVTLRIVSLPVGRGHSGARRPSLSLSD